MKIYFDGKNYVCPRCGKTFKSKMQVVGHQRTHKFEVKRINVSNEQRESNDNGGGASFGLVAPIGMGVGLQNWAVVVDRRLESIETRLMRLERILTNEVPHRRAIAEAESGKNLLKWVAEVVSVGILALAFYKLLTGKSEESEKVFWKVAEKSLSKVY